MTTRYRSRAAAAVALAGVLALPPMTAGAAESTQTSVAATGLPIPAAARGCYDLTVALPYEEAMLAQPQAQRFVIEGGFASRVARFAIDLCRAKNPAAARAVVDQSGRQLWRTAVDRAQGRVQMGTLSAADDRPLYWARLGMVTALRAWKPAKTLKPAERARLIGDLDRVSRGQDDIHYTAGMKRILVTGFDPFTLNRDIRQGNPSGVGALALDGKVIDTPTGPARIETAMFPVRWRDFADGMVERTLLPWLRKGPNRVDAFATVSQGRPGRFDLEQTNGAWRAGFGDNEGVCYRGQVPIKRGTPTVRPQPQWTSSTLPMSVMTGVGGAFPVVHNTEVTEVPAGTPQPGPTLTCPAASSAGIVRADGPTPGSLARSGGGGNYLSNEIAYRATLLRDAVGLKVPGGHIHTPVLNGLPTDLNQLSSPTFEANRTAIVDQLTGLVTAEAATVPGR